jgi:hypothetical protein
MTGSGPGRATDRDHANRAEKRKRKPDEMPITTTRTLISRGAGSFNQCLLCEASRNYVVGA